MDVDKISTGIAGLDRILNGGYLKYKSTLLKGSAGTGKTLFTLFFAYSQLKNNHHVIYVTCDEPPSQILSYMDHFGLEGSRFVKEKKLQILDLTPVFNQEISGEFDITALQLRIEQAKKGTHAEILIIDSIQSLLLGLEAYEPHYELLNLYHWAKKQGLTVLTTIADIKTIFKKELFEEYIVDCVIELTQLVNRNLMTRNLRVIKLRGSAHGTNVYPFSIFHNGISLLPITETRLESGIKREYIKTGIKGLDAMLDDRGYQAGAIIMISGRSGTAKTIFAATHAEAAAKQKHKVLYLSFEESPGDLVTHLTSAGIHLDPLLKKNLLMVHSRRSVEMGLEDHIISIIELIERHKFDFLVLDSISALLDLGTERDVKMLLIRFISYMKSNDITLVFTELLSDASMEKSNLGISSMADTWLRLLRIETDGEYSRLMHIAKSRGCKISNQIREFTITEDGLSIEPPYIGDQEMVYGAKKAAYELMDNQQSSRRLQEIKRLEQEILALEAELSARQKIQEAKIITKKNELLRQIDRLSTEEKQFKARQRANRLLRE
ncbi:circadian clock protein KaiC [Legionella londiniensis]|uniref:non-specific serine/threonine protein kinase n=1 Tax=Legionella londiniensis TaxID=45068 RepID=A0A0W0VNU8_9GAMM|nr:circadian clock protein KaiC [Legionella londiniensis]KTD21767.1 DNA integration/recombination/inversion protein [Legionella londiniensis]STX92143.1 DNA integration/recombination/inversion protein [Legionella londiniensis]